MPPETLPNKSPSSSDTVSNLLALLSNSSALFSDRKSSITQTDSISSDGLNALLQHILESNSGLAQVASGEKGAGLYNSSTNQLLINDLLTRAAGEVQSRNTTRTVTSNHKAPIGSKVGNVLSSAAALKSGYEAINKFSKGALGKKVDSAYDYVQDQLFGTGSSPTAGGSTGSFSSGSSVNTSGGLGNIGSGVSIGSGGIDSIIANTTAGLNSADAFAALLNNGAITSTASPTLSITGGTVGGTALFAPTASAGYGFDAFAGSGYTFGADTAASLGLSTGTSGAAAGGFGADTAASLGISEGASGASGASAGAGAGGAVFANYIPLVAAAIEKTDELGNDDSVRNVLNDIDPGGQATNLVYDVFTHPENALSNFEDNFKESVQPLVDLGSSIANAVGWVICTELKQQGELSPKIYFSAAKHFLALPEETKRGYHWWAIPVTRAIRRGGFSGRILKKIFTRIARSRISYLNGDSTASVGKFTCKVIEPLCNWIGRKLSKRPEWEKLYGR